jgi:GcrA cell cycle regulator
VQDGLWTKERGARLKHLWAQGKTAAAIAVELGGISRSAVLGKIFRLRLAPGESARTKNREKRKTERERGKATCAARTHAPRRRRAAKAKPANKARPAKGPTRRTLLELINDCCRWPHGQPGRKNFFFCGAAGADLERGIPYSQTTKR